MTAPSRPALTVADRQRELRRLAEVGDDMDYAEVARRLEDLVGWRPHRVPADIFRHWLDLREAVADLDALHHGHLTARDIVRHGDRDAARDWLEDRVQVALNGLCGGAG